MPASYFNRLIVISDMLNSPNPTSVQDGLDLLLELVRENSQDPDFINEIKALTDHLPALSPKIQEMIHQSRSKDSPVSPDTSRGNMKLPAPKVFISYSHRDEKFKDELVTMLIPLQTHGVIEIWQDRRIEEGEEWYQAIQEAMSTCDLALLLVSKHFLASSFISREELPELLQQRKAKGLRVVPIIISECMWQSVPALKDLQALPKDGKAIVSFKGTGGRDIVWTEIAKIIENRAKKLREGS